MAVDANGDYIPDANDYQYGGDGQASTVQDPSGEGQAYFQQQVPDYQGPTSVEDAYAAALATSGVNLWGREARTTEATPSATADSSQTSWVDAAMKKAKDLWGWADKEGSGRNPLLMAGLMGLSNAQNNANKREMAATQQQYQMEQLNQKYANERKTAEDNSAAISAIPKKQGLIQTALKRIDGTPVFNTNGTVKA